MRKLVTGYIGFVVLLALCLAVPPLLVIAVPLVVWRMRSFRNLYRSNIRDAETDLRAQYSATVTEARMRHARAWR